MNNWVDDVFLNDKYTNVFLSYFLFKKMKGDKWKTGEAMVAIEIIAEQKNWEQTKGGKTK